MSSSQAERKLILLSAGTAARRQVMREYASRVTAEVDWSRLGETLRLRRLLPTLGPRVVELAEGGASDDFVASVEQAIATGRRQGAFLQLVCARVMAALANAGIRSRTLKGPTLGEALYGDVGRRLSSDIDLLVATEQLHDAVDVVRELGYDAPADHIRDHGLPLLHFALMHEEEKLPPVELHWCIHWYERDFARDRLLPPIDSVSSDWNPAAADELAALLLFYARDGFIDLRLASDLSAWWDIHGADLPHGALGAALSAYPALSRVLRVATTVAEKVVGLPAQLAIDGLPSLGVRGRTAVRLANPHPHSSESQLYADMGLIDGLLMPRGDFRGFIRRQLLLPREVLEQLDQRAPKRRARSPVGRGAGVLGRYGVTMTRLMRTPETLR
jgi:Uncharacterised nucleotidyltransferase